MIRWLSPLLAVSVAGCVLAPIDFSGRRCPCGTGWVCERGVCIPEGDQLDAGPDAGLDAARPDAGIDAPIDAYVPPGIDGGLDTGVDAGPDPDHCDDLWSGALFCDGFESDIAAGDLGRWSWPFTRMGTVETVGTPEPFLGIGALRAQTLEAGGRAAMGVDLGSTTADGELWLRGVYYFESATTIDSLSLLYMGSVDGAEGLALQTYGGGQLAVWIGSISEWRGTTVPLPRDRWTCLEMHVVLGEGTTPGYLEAYLDGVMVVRHDAIDTIPGAGVADVEAGIEYSGTTQVPAQVFVDEVVLSRERAPCTP